MTWQVQRDGYTATWVDPYAIPTRNAEQRPYVCVTGEGIKGSGMEFAIPADCVMDGCDYMCACITYARASLEGQTVRQAVGTMKGART